MDFKVLFDIVQYCVVFYLCFLGQLMGGGRHKGKNRTLPRLFLCFKFEVTNIHTHTQSLFFSSLFIGRLLVQF